MKAESFIFTSTHRPLTVFGLPPVLLAVTLASFGVVFAMMVILGVLFMALPISSVVFVLTAVFFYRRTRQDHHFVNTLIVPPRFWRGRKVRRLIAGSNG